MAHLVRVRPVLALTDPNTATAAEAVNVALEVVLEGTTTQVPLFQDRAGTMPLPQPITAGARGFTQEFWAQVETLTTELAWLSGGLRGGAIEYDKEAAAIAQDAVTKADETLTRTAAALQGVDKIELVPGWVQAAEGAALDSAGSANRARTEGREAAVEALASDPTVRDAATAAVTADIAGRNIPALVPRVVQIPVSPDEDPVMGLAMEDEDGRQFATELAVNDRGEVLPSVLAAFAERGGYAHLRQLEQRHASVEETLVMGVPFEDGQGNVYWPESATNIYGEFPPSTLAAMARRGGFARSVEPFRPVLTPVPASVKASNAGILKNALKYNLTTWYPAEFGSQSANPYLSFVAASELRMRPPGLVAYGIAVAIAAGDYDAAFIGVSEGDARAIAIRLAVSVAKYHKVNRASGSSWGGTFQTGLWATMPALACRMLWDYLTVDEKAAIDAMLLAEADFALKSTVPYYRDRAGTILYPGNSQGEENAWVVMPLACAVLTNPGHVDAGAWMAKMTEYALSCGSRPFDLTAPMTVHGSPVGDVLNGSNFADDGTMINHGGVHPDYMSSVCKSLSVVIGMFARLGKVIPAGLTHNLDVIYTAFVDREFPAGSYNAPGGKIYQADGSIYYPQVADWGNIVIDKATLDVLAIAWGLDHAASVKATHWAGLHLSASAALQARYTTGQMYADGAAGDAEYGTPMREQIVLYHAATAALAVMATTGTARFSNATTALIAAQNRS